jgi:tetratricopeptide (TPR) repeat protein
MACHNQEEAWEELSNKRYMLYQMRRHEESAKVGDEALRVAEKTFGPNHPKTALSMNELAIVYQYLGKYAEADDLFKRALMIREQALGPKHPFVAATCEHMAALYRQIGKGDEAERFETRVRKTRSN